MFFSDLAKLIPEELVTFLMAMVPIIEVKGSIPFGMTVLEMSPAAALLISLTGNILISVAVLLLLEPVTKFLRKHNQAMDSFFGKLFAKTHQKHSKRMSELGHLALFLFIAAPIPGSGGWSGALISYVFGVPRKIAVPILCAGLTITALLVTFGTEGLIMLF